MPIKKPYSAIDLFSGCGGFSLGIENAGFSVAAAIDNDQCAVETYQANFPDTELILKKDLQTFAPLKLSRLMGKKTIDVIIGGPPCQGFSLARKVDGSNHGDSIVRDARRFLFRNFLEYVKYFRPKIFLMENVRGIKTAGQRKIFNDILIGAKQHGYQVDETLVRAWEFGVPQKRIRQIFVGVHADLPKFNIGDWLKLTHANLAQKNTEKLKSPVTLWEAIGDLPTLRPGEEKNTYDMSRRKTQFSQYGKRYLEDVLNIHESTQLTSHISRAHSERDLRDFKRLKEGESSAQALARGVEMEFPYTREIFKDRYTRQHRNRMSSTIVAHLSKDGLMFIHPTQNRTLTPREAARIQSFPDTFKFPVARTHQYRLIGNAVPPLLGEALGRAVRHYLESSIS